MAETPKVEPEDVFGTDPIALAFAGQGMTRKKLARFFTAKMNARETKFFAHQGKVEEVRHVIAHDVQLRAGIEVAKMLKMYPNAKVELEGDLNITVSTGIDRAPNEEPGA